MAIRNLPRLHVGVGWRAEGLTLFPVWAEMDVNDVVVVDAADVRVEERTGSPSVEELVLHNGGDRPVLLLEGELLEGGWQDRVLDADLLLGPRESQVAPVTCVEQGRWSGDAQHARRARMAPGGIRVGLRQRNEGRQQDVWRRVSRYEPTLGRTQTTSLSAQLDRVSAGRDAAGRPLGRARRCEVPGAPLPGQVGVVACLGGRPAWLEVLPSPAALGTFWSSLVDAVLLDAYSAPAVPCPGQAARDFAVHCRSLTLQSGEAAGAGRSVNARHRGIDIRGITSPEGGLLHAMAVDTDARLWGEA